MYLNYGKRIFDFIIALIGMVLLFPLLLLIAILVKREFGDSIIFKQKRAGKNGVPFFIYKFRTMKTLYDNQGYLLPDEVRLTAFGHWLRKISLDELPQLWNILKGDMSLVGPRPYLLEYVPLYTKEQARRLEVRSGLTGWQQIQGRNKLAWHEKFKYDLWYINHVNFFLDLRILFKTISCVIKGEGVNEAGFVSSSRFRGEES